MAFTQFAKERCGGLGNLRCGRLALFGQALGRGIVEGMHRERFNARVALMAPDGREVEGV